MIKLNIKRFLKKICPKELKINSLLVKKVFNKTSIIAINDNVY